MTARKSTSRTPATKATRSPEPATAVNEHGQPVPQPAVRPDTIETNQQSED